MSARRARLGGLALAATGSVLFSVKAIIVKLSYRYGVDPVTLIALRMVFALPLFALAAWLAGRDASYRLGTRDVAPIVGMGLVGYYLASLLDFIGLQYISAGLERVILYLNPTLVVLISVLVLRKRIVPLEWVALFVAYSGVLFVFWHDLSVSGEDVPLGAALVFASALAYAVYLVAGGELVGRIGPIRLTAWASIVACVACLVQALALDAAALVSQPAPVYGLSIVNAVVCTVIPIFMVMVGVARVGSSAAAQTGMLGPAATIGLAALLLDEPVSATQLLGTAIVLTGVFLLTIKRD
ncbi:MAG: DMT family transporter [Burkholderiaceae bacterium]|nr:DMT family transporter [Burkholderiaceae bacterium]